MKGSDYFEFRFGGSRRKEKRCEFFGQVVLRLLRMHVHIFSRKPYFDVSHCIQETYCDMHDRGLCMRYALGIIDGCENLEWVLYKCLDARGGAFIASRQQISEC